MMCCHVASGSAVGMVMVASLGTQVAAFLSSASIGDGRSLASAGEEWLTSVAEVK